MLANQANAFRAGISGKKMPGWCPPGSLLAKSYRLGRKYYHSTPFQIEGDEWYFKGCFIQKNSHPNLFGKYEVFADDEQQTHIGRFTSFANAKKACKANEVKNPFIGILKIIGK